MTTLFRMLLLTIIGLASLGAAAPPQIQRIATVPITGLSAPEPACIALRKNEFSTIEDAPTQITGVSFVPAAAGQPGQCRVQGYATPNIGFEMRMPASGWNGKFVKLGCGGFCGTIFADACNAIVARGYACLAGNMGHVSTGLDAKWAYNNLAAKFDFGSRSIHVSALVGKALAAAYYGTAPKRAYHLGCSTGGREGMVAAQRFPKDYDGIVAGAPPLNETGAGVSLLWNAQAMMDANGRPVMSIDALRLVHRAAIAACDPADGLKDGLIGDPEACRFDPAVLQCKAGADSAGGECLSPTQVAAVRRVYAGASNGRGQRYYAGTAMPGSELNWIGNYLSPDNGPSIYASFIGDMMKYMNFVPDLGPSWSIARFDWDRDPERTRMMEALYNAQNPDLRQFRDNGGRLILYQGWADQSILPGNIIDYYRTVERTMGGRAETQAFARLFMVPGMNHCAGGEGATMIDFLGALDSWVETGRAPDRLVGYHPRNVAATVPFGGAFPAAPDAEFARPLYPWPLVVRYRGHGDPASADSFAAR